MISRCQIKAFYPVFFMIDLKNKNKLKYAICVSFNYNIVDNKVIPVFILISELVLWLFLLFIPNYLLDYKYMHSFKNKCKFHK